MKIDFATVHQKILKAYLGLGGTQHFRSLRNEILASSGWTYPEYEESCLTKLTDTSN
jgi:hypothetical protein